MNFSKKHKILIVVAVAIALAIFYFESSKIDFSQQSPPDQSSDVSSGLKKGMYQKAPALRNIEGWINTPDNGPISIDQYKGKVVLIDFWTYSCINCLRTLPYLNAWHETYADDGLVIIGVHTPEFSFEKKYENVQAFVNKNGIKYAVVLDNDYGTWTNYQNSYWPRKYLIDKGGFIRYDHIGEGGYDETEMKIRELLEENAQSISDARVNIEEKTPTTRNTPELYLGYQFVLPRGQNIGNDGGLIPAVSKTYAFDSAETMRSNVIYLGGTWDSDSDAIVSMQNATLYLRFTAKNANIVLEGNDSISVYLDGLPITVGAGKDVSNGVVFVNEPRLYELYSGTYGTHLLELRFDSNIRANAFTFG